MRATTDKATDWSGIYTGVDKIRMSKEQRRQAYASVQQAELIADVVLFAVHDMGAIARGVEHAAASVTSGIKSMFARPVKH